MANSITSPMGVEHSKGLSDLADDLFHPLEQEGLRHRVLGRLFGTAPASVRLGRYHVLEAIGRGAMGTVYAAYDDKLDRKVAIKLLHASADDSETRERLLREARALGRLSHPHVVQVHDVGEWDDKVFVAMEFVSGTTLREWLDARDRAPSEILTRFCEAGEGLAAAHEAGVVHRDFKPENVLVGAEDGRVRVADFGLAFATLQETREAIAAISDTALDQAVLTRTGLVLGTPAYMAPEQLQGGRVDPRTDQFAFAVALHEALFGTRPFGGNTLAALDESIAAGPGSPRATMRVTSCVRKALTRALAYAPEDRFGSMRELLAMLTRSRRRAKGAPGAITTLGGTFVVTMLVLIALGVSKSRVPDVQQQAMAARLAINESVHARERDAEQLADAAALIDVDPTAAVMELGQIAAEGWTPDAAQLLAVARLHGVATRIVRFDHPIELLDARAGWIRWEEPADKAFPSGPWQAVAHEAVGGVFVAAPRSGMWPDLGGRLLSYYEQGRGLQAWPLDGSATRNLGAEGHHHEVLLAVDPRGEFAAILRDDIVIVHDVSTGTATPHAGFVGLDVATAALAPAGGELAHLTGDGRLVRHDLTTREQRIEGDRLGGALRYSADGRWLGGQYADGRLMLLDREAGEMVETPDDPISTYAFAPKGARLVTCPAGSTGAGPTATVWALPSLHEVDVVRGDPRGRCDIDFSADGDIVVVATAGYDAVALDLRSGWSLRPRGGPRLVAATVSSDGASLTTMHDGEVRVWSLADLHQPSPQRARSLRSDVSYVGPSMLLVNDLKGASLFDRETGKSSTLFDSAHSLIRTAGVPHRLSTAAVTATGIMWAKNLGVGAQLGGAERTVKTVLASHDLREIMLSPNGERLLALSDDGDVLIHEVSTAKERRIAACSASSRDLPSWHQALWGSRDGKRVAASAAAGVLCIWDTTTGASISRLEEDHGTWVLSPDLRIAIHHPTAPQDPDRVIDLERGTVWPLPSEAQGLAVTGAGVAIYEEDDVTWAWELATDERWPLYAGDAPHFAEASPDDRELLLLAYRGAVRFVSLDRPADLGPAEAAALTEVVTLSPTKLQ